MHPYAIELFNVCKQYGTSPHSPIPIRDYTQKVAPQTMTAIMGPSGSGKTTLLYLIAGILQPSSGNILVNGSDITHYSEREMTEFRRRNIGFIFQRFNLITTLTVKENILLPLYCKHTPTYDADRCHAALGGLAERLDIEHLLQRFPEELSGGEQQRVAIARAFLPVMLFELNDAILLADEPTGNLDAAHSQELCELISELCRDYDMTAVIATHDQHVAAYCQNTYTL